jgi:hypothetical protein
MPATSSLLRTELAIEASVAAVVTRRGRWSRGGSLQRDLRGASSHQDELR